MANEEKHVSGPETTPLPDERMGKNKGAMKRVTEGGSPSPRRQKGSDSVAVDVETLRTLLAEQSAALLARVMLRRALGYIIFRRIKKVMLKIKLSLSKVAK